MTEKEQKLYETTTLTIINKDDYGFEISEAKEVNNIFQGFSTKFQIEYAKMLDDYIYKNIPTNVLEGMKLKIENELMERKLKDNDRQRDNNQYR